MPLARLRPRLTDVVIDVDFFHVSTSLHHHRRRRCRHKYAERMMVLRIANIHVNHLIDCILISWLTVLINDKMFKINVITLLVRLEPIFASRNRHGSLAATWVTPLMCIIKIN